MGVEVTLACRLHTELGEGPVWLPQEQALWFVDIKLGRLHRFDPATRRCSTHEVGGNPSFVVPTHDGDLLVASRNALHRFDGDLSAPLLRIEMPGHNRTNDATVDDAGRLWFGTMDDEERRPTGALYCFDGSALEGKPWNAVVTNGPALSIGSKWLYHLDSGNRTIWRISLSSGHLARTREVFLPLAEDDGYPDGVVVDSEDCLWAALWDGATVRRYGSDGTFLLQVDVPCSRPTKLAFGGPGLRTAFVTTARVGLDAETLAAQPLAGSLLSFAAPAPGRLLPAVRLV
jgi:sugar lactone lactonase YvrE